MTWSVNITNCPKRKLTNRDLEILTKAIKRNEILVSWSKDRYDKRYTTQVNISAHGGIGEDGMMQALLENEGVIYTCSLQLMMQPSKMSSNHKVLKPHTFPKALEHQSHTNTNTSSTSTSIASED
ncbi:hypothetical protein YC2023_045756 [Brassica napus]